MRIPADITDLIERGALVAINHSGGKDSQAMSIRLVEAGIPRDQLLIVHATLGDVEWPGTISHIRKTTFGLPPVIARPRRSFFEMVRARGMFPSPRYRQCTSDQKRGPIERELRRYLAANPRFAGRIVSAMGMRAEESAARWSRHVVRLNNRNSVAGRTWIDWLPIHELSRREVFDAIAAAGQEPHWAYGRGMTRLSCSFCIMSSLADLRCAARLRPDLLSAYMALEDEIGHTLRPDGTNLRETLNRLDAA
ncbi:MULTISPECIES: phosphoadenosine phosphosulfate reductase domain-containing protein [Rhodobacterales]|jgi:3'-phosphoadenosine 5'-phosphosulfate sulfotransferase (PAPS reductase)/FAD synthetase|uniref:3'-phosphoadenosine 5'-phosphosulfate sulfotransferase (PAPS reductase)/FAD synthetase n=3 Tax=Rhodobacterales TaxID=204455 RepID=A0A1I7AG04_9RHOB|nr:MULTISPECIES: phosphoadenosine phosphosulfate reductase family protein [Rhodobacterales]APE46211.1 phosphoadenosine phosphosulfate reductase [Sulfitobacter alexandrii]AUC56325.1 phosphoadenosine phosphosulfate reductase [Sagittula sp. P11]SDO55643.1 3'-phosphoadenosine 5'-phosphosulfate sulfotransferase (PAPS reductase)/FAD synthetase [Lutimaribacter pacificus]SFT73881.1 3'-phosphoadenosine 5'-phosphosulfate sulfotransferase (PAPS reductase)/FAD synthetase [Sedimentitalea nanhaiensis]SHK620